MAIPVKAPTLEVHINADRKLVFQYLTAFGAAGPDGEKSSTVLQDEGDRKLVEFQTTVRGLWGRTRRVRTVEWVTINEPETIDFEGVKGPLPLLRDHFDLIAHGSSCTVMRYQSTFGAHGWYFGWPVARFYVKPRMERMMREHMADLKQAIEARAAKSKAFPHEACAHDTADGPVPVLPVPVLQVRS